MGNACLLASLPKCIDPLTFGLHPLINVHEITSPAIPGFPSTQNELEALDGKLMAMMVYHLILKMSCRRNSKLHTSCLELCHTRRGFHRITLLQKDGHSRQMDSWVRYESDLVAQGDIKKVQCSGKTGLRLFQERQKGKVFANGHHRHLIPRPRTRRQGPTCQSERHASQGTLNFAQGSKLKDIC